MADGHILVQIADEMNAPGHVLDVFDSSGVFLGSLDLGFSILNRSEVALRGDTLFAVTLDDLDIPSVVKLVIQRPSRL